MIRNGIRNGADLPWGKTMLKRRTLLAGLGAALLPLGRMAPVGAVPWAGRPVYVQRGQASWYGRGFGNRRTASGERFDQHRMTAAHRSLPLGSVVRVVATESGEAVDVLINDRGPHRRGRIIDLSPAAAQRLKIKGDGIADVVVEAYAEAQPSDAMREALLQFAAAQPPRGGIAPPRRQRHGQGGNGPMG
jgi:rare lipoprotein A